MRDLHKETPTKTLPNPMKGKSTEKTPKIHKKLKLMGLTDLA
jgi:hypothetical protein